MSLARDYRDKSNKVRINKCTCRECAGIPDKRKSRRLVRRVTKVKTKLETREQET